jgi:hypothetical protein
VIELIQPPSHLNPVPLVPEEPLVPELPELPEVPEVPADVIPVISTVWPKLFVSSKVDEPE